MQKEIYDRLANLLLAGALEDGTAVKVDVSEDAPGLKVGPLA